MTMPPMGYGESLLCLTIEDVFHIKGRGTVVTGQLRGDGELHVGDTMLCDGRSWQIRAIEQFRAQLTTALPSSNIGILIADEHGADLLRGLTAQFEPGSASMGSRGQFTVRAPKKKRWRS